MRNEDNECIRYLMKEMDPSEELLMERAMMEDEDLLIEVESMRQTLQKMDKLPEMEPPSDVTNAILEKAAEQAEKNRKANRTLSPVFKYAVAATLALTMSAGGMWFYVGSENEPRKVEQASAASSTLPSSTNANGVGDLTGIQLISSGYNAQQESEQPKVEPWIDRNNILRYEDQFSDQDGSYQAIIENATQKLRPIEHTTPSNDRVNPVQLTGSGN